MLNALLQDPKLARLTKSQRDLVLAFAEALEKDAGGTPGAPSPILKQIAERERIARDANPSDRYISTELTDLSMAYLQDQGAYTAGARGVKPVRLNNGKYRIWNRGDFFRDDAEPRAPATRAGGGKFALTRGDYACVRYAYAHDVDDETMMFDVVDDPRMLGLAVVTQKLLIRRDALWIANLFKAGLWTTDETGVAGAPGANQFKQWDQSGATPRSDLMKYAIGINERTGLWANVLTLNAYVLKGLLTNADVTTAFQYTTAGAVPTMAQLARALFSLVDGVPDPSIQVAGAIKTTSAKGAAADTFAYMAGKHALLAHVPSTFGLNTPTAYATFSLENEGWATNANGVRISDYEEEDRKVPHRIEGEIFIDPKPTAVDLGAFLATAVS